MSNQQQYEMQMEIVHVPLPPELRSRYVRSLMRLWELLEEELEKEENNGRTE